MTDAFASALGTRMTVVGEQSSDEAGKTLRSVNSANSQQFWLECWLLGAAWGIVTAQWLYVS